MTSPNPRKMHMSDGADAKVCALNTVVKHTNRLDRPVDMAGDHIIGPPKAPITLREPE